MRPRRIPTVMMRVRMPTQARIKEMAKARGKTLTDYVDELFKRELRKSAIKKKIIRR